MALPVLFVVAVAIKQEDTRDDPLVLLHQSVHCCTMTATRGEGSDDDRV